MKKTILSIIFILATMVGIYLIFGPSDYYEHNSSAHSVSILKDFIPDGCYIREIKSCEEMLYKECSQYDGIKINNEALVPELCRFKIGQQQFHYDKPLEVICDGKTYEIHKGEEVGNWEMCGSKYYGEKFKQLSEADQKSLRIKCASSTNIWYDWPYKEEPNKCGDN